LPSSDRTNLIPNMRYLNMPLETDIGSTHQLNIQCPSMICSYTISKINTNRTRS
jgi:hypothetical protein